MSAKKRWSVYLALLAISSLSLLLSPCSSEQAPAPPGKELRSSLQRVSSPDVEQEDIARQVVGNTDFALDLYRELVADGQENVFFSPYNLEIALAMTWAGARGQTETEMASAMHFVLDQEHLHPVFNHLDQRFASDAGDYESDDRFFRLQVINKIWSSLEMEHQIESGFLDTLALHYGTGLYLLDFYNDPAGSCREINDWVAQVTEGRIQDLIPPAAIESKTRMVLVNAITFKGAWEYPFDEDDTSQGDFQTADGRTVSVPMMHQTAAFPYEEGDGYQAVELPYIGGGLCMLILAPDLGSLDAFEQGLDAAFVELVHRAMIKGHEVRLSMPRWREDGLSFRLKGKLERLGMEQAFHDGGADFSGISSSDHTLFISDVLHQAFVEVNEAGTEAAAASAVIVDGDGSMPPQGPPIHLDRPFVYFILDEDSGQVLFMGREVDPS